MMGLWTIIQIVLYEVQRLKLIITVCGPNCQKGTSCHHHVVTVSGAHPIVTVSSFPWSRNLKTCLHLEEDKEYMGFNFVEFCALITILYYLWLLKFI